jgi:hypothetical protein
MRHRSKMVSALVMLMAATGCGSSDSEPSKAADGGINSDVAELDRTPPLEGWRWESSLGVEVAVPADWTINDTDCNQTDAPSVVRAQGAVQDCLTAEPAGKQIVEIMPDDSRDVERPQSFTFRDITIDDEAAERGEGEMPDGRAAGWLHIPGVGVVVDARVKDRDTLRKVLDSVRIVDVDRNACARSLAQMPAVAPKATTLVPRDADALSVCWFVGGVLGSSALIEGTAAEKIVTALNDAKPGRNVDVPETNCLRDGKVPPPDTVLIAHAKGDRAVIELSFSGCTHRGSSNGRDEAQLTEKLVLDIMAPLHSGYGYSPYGLR